VLVDLAKDGGARPAVTARKEKGNSVEISAVPPIAKKTVRRGSELFGQNSQVPEIGDRVSNRKGTPHVRP
jgi:hypothetical protein